MPTRRAALASLLTVGAGGYAGCLGRDDGSGEPPTATDGGSPGTPAPIDGDAEHWHTRPAATGNRAIDAAGDLRGVDPARIPVDGRPTWLVAHPAEEGSHWTVVTEGGRAARWHVAAGDATREGEYDPLPAGTPPVVETGGPDPRLLNPPGMATTAAPAVAPGDPPKLLFLASDGDLVVAGDAVTRLAVEGLPDGRIVALGDGRFALFGDTTDRYRHGALGDPVEGSRLVVVDPGKPAVVADATLGTEAVFEGLGPLVADVDGDGDPEVVTTVADTGDGARIAVFDADANRVATGPIHEPGWRHQLVVAPLGPNGEPELAVVRKPHVERLLELYRLRDGDLSVVATLSGFSTHTYGSRITDGAVAGDLDDDGATEVLLPPTARDELAAVRHTAGGPAVAWRLPLPGTVRTNVTGIGTAAGVAVGAGDGEAVYVWEG